MENNMVFAYGNIFYFVTDEEISTELNFYLVTYRVKMIKIIL